MQGSVFSPFLHDAMYLYALALNKTLEKGEVAHDGKVLIANTKLVTPFRGMTFL